MDINYWLNFKDYTVFQLTIALIGSVLWVLVYFFLIKDTLQKKYIEMPFFIACGNFAWEILYAYFFDGYINLGQIYVYGYRAWFFMDIFIFALLLKYGTKQTDSPLIKKNFKIINTALLAFFIIMLYAWISEGFDNTPIHGDGSVKLGATSAFVLNFGITVIYFAHFLKQHQTYKFSKPIAWCKGIGTALFTILFWQVDPENFFLQTLGVFIGIGDAVYIVFLYTFKSQKSVKFDFRKIKFKKNDVFEDVWRQSPGYLLIRNTKIRYIERPEWHYKSPDGKYETIIGVAEGNILIEKAKGEVESKSAKAGLDVVDRIVCDLGLENKPYYYISDTRQITKASFNTRKLIVDFHESHTNLKHFVLIANGFTRVLLKLMNPISPEVINNWITSSDLESAIADIFDAENQLHQFEYFDDIDSARMEKVYDFISKLSVRQFDSIQKIDISENDRFYGLVTALEILKNDYRDLLKEMNTMLNNSRQALKEQELHFRSLFENSNEIVFVIDSNDQIVNFNNGLTDYLKEFGLQLTSGYNISNYLSQENLEFYRSVKKDLLLGKKKEFEIDYKTNDGQVLWFHCKCYSVKISEKQTYQVYLMDDITEEKKWVAEKQVLNQTIFNQNLKINEFSSVLANNLKQHPEKIASVIENLKKSLVFTQVNVSNITALRDALDEMNGVLGDLDRVLNEMPLSPLEEDKKEGLGEVEKRLE